MSNLRAYLAGTGATGALVAGAVVVFLAVAALLGFNGIPDGGTEQGPDSLFVGTADAPLAAATAAASASSSVASGPATSETLLASTGTGGGPGGTTPPGVGPPGPGGGPGPLPCIGTVCPPQPPPICVAGGLCPDLPGPGTSAGLLNSTAGTVDGTTNVLLGVNLNLQGMTSPLTGPLDGTVNNLLRSLGLRP